MLKKILTITCLLLMLASVAAGDEIDEALSDIASSEVVQSTRQLVQAGIDRHSAVEVTRAMVQNRFQAGQILDVHQEILNASRQGLPPDPIINKAFEGMSKNIQADRIISAVKKVGARYRFAHRQAMALTEEKTQINKAGYLIASAMAAGITQKGIETITGSLQERLQAGQADQRDALVLETFLTVRDMARLGVSSAQTVGLVCEALQHRFMAHQMQNMRAAFLKDSRATAPENLAAGYRQAIEQGKDFESPGSSAGKGSPGEAGGAGGAGGGNGGGNGGGGPGGRK